MRSNTEFKMPFVALDSPRWFITVFVTRTAQYVSDCQGFVHDTELFNVVIVFLMAKE